jgi:molybdopterin-guanine dinucleotide biosynthesis protein A
VTEPLTGLILAGGKSSRFGSDKASALLQGRPLLQWVVGALSEVCNAVVVVKAAGQALPAFECRVAVDVVEDLYEGKGPLAGLVAGFGSVRTPLCFAASCDAPLVQPALIHLLADRAAEHDIVSPFVGGFLQPLVAVYRPASCLPVFRDFVERDLLKITAAFGPLDSVIVAESEVAEADPGFSSFLNANRPERLAEIAALLDSGK